MSSIQENVVTVPPLKYNIASRSADIDSSRAIPPKTSSPFRIVHISDPHLSRRYYREHIKSLKLLLATIMERGFDHLVISGDIVSTADEQDYALARELFDRFGLLRGNAMTVVPGNHDVFGGPHRAIDILSFPRHIRTVDYQRHLDLFLSAFAETFDGALRLSNKGPFPFIKPAGPFLLIGLNSIPPWSLWNNPLGTNGLLDEQQKDGLLSLEGADLLNDHIPIAVIHHHFQDNAKKTREDSSVVERIESRTMRMKKRRSTLRLFERLGVRIVLHGHVHRNEIYDRGNLLLANGAGSVCDDPVQFLKYNEIISSGGTLSATTHLLPIPFHAAAHQKGFRSITRKYPSLPQFLPQPSV